MGLKVAIVGMAPDSHAQAPWHDPEWELWGLTWDVDRLRFHRTFEMHDMATLRLFYPDLKAYLERLKDCASPYMQEQYPEVPNCRRYPLEEVAAICGNYFCSSIAYALGLAIHEGAEEIALWGVNMSATDEWGYQRPNAEYLIGVARGRGIKVQIPDSSPILKFKSDPDFHYVGRYGWLG